MKRCDDAHSPSEDSLYVSHLDGTVRHKSVPPRWDTSRKPRYGRVDICVTSDPDLSDKSVRVYTAMATLERGGSVTAGIREIARAANCSKGATERRIEELVKCQHVQINTVTAGRRQSYKLLSPVFAQKNEDHASKQAESVQKVENTGEPKGQLLTCGICHEKRRSLPRTGVCRTCKGQRDVMAMAAKMPDATPGQVYAEVKAAKSKIMQGLRKQRRKTAAA